MRKKAVQPIQPIVDDRYLDIVLDAGNSQTKAWRLGALSGVCFPSAVSPEPPGQYEQRTQMFANQPSALERTAVFSTPMQPSDVGGYVVGEQAAQLGRTMTLTHVAKYTVGYMDVLLLAALQQIAPDGHDAVRVAVAYPSGAAAHIDQVKRCLYENCVPPVRLPGKQMSKAKIHRVKRLDGALVEYVLKGVTAWEEPLGGVFRFFTHASAPVSVGDQVLMVDIGGGITSLTPTVVVSGERFEVLSARARHFPVGINDVKRALDAELKQYDPETFRTTSVPASLLEQALRTAGSARVRGETHDYQIPVLNAVGQLRRQIETVFYGEFGGGLDIDHVVLTGGGGGLLFELLRTTVFAQHASLHLADAPDAIHFANVRGAAHSFALYLAQQRP